MGRGASCCRSRATAAEEVLAQVGRDALRGKLVIDTTNPITDEPPEQGVLKSFTDLNSSLMERLQRSYPEARFVKAFNCVGSARMVDPDFGGTRPTMFYCGDDADAKATVARILDQFGWDSGRHGRRDRGARHRAAGGAVVHSGIPAGQLGARVASAAVARGARRGLRRPTAGSPPPARPPRPPPRGSTRRACETARPGASSPCAARSRAARRSAC